MEIREACVGPAYAYLAPRNESADTTEAEQRDDEGDRRPNRGARESAIRESHGVPGATEADEGKAGSPAGGVRARGDSPISLKRATRVPDGSAAATS